MTRGLTFLIEDWRRERPDVDLTAFIIAAAIKQIDQQSEAEFRRLSADMDIGPGDLRVLFALRRSGPDHPLRPTDLFQSLLVTSGAVTKQVDRLENERLVERLPDPSYQRGSLIRISRRGMKITNAAIEAICSDKTTIGKAISALSEEDRELGKQFLQRLLAKFEALNAETAPSLPKEPPARRSAAAKNIAILSKASQSVKAKPSRGKLASGASSRPKTIKG